MAMEAQALAVQRQDEQTDLEAYSPREMAIRLADMKQKLSLTQSFFKEIMVKDQDYGIIPGTDKPTLLKPGAEKLCELYGYAITVKDLRETVDQESGYYRAIATVALMHRKSGTIVAEGVGEANTMEGRYRWRWIPEWKLPKGIDKDSLHCEERENRKGSKYKMYKVENEDPWALWNTVLKMAKKRGLIDAVLSATRSSGLFTQDLEDLQEWVQSGESIDAQGVSSRRPEPPSAPRPKARNGKTNGKNGGASEVPEELMAARNRLYATADAYGINGDQVISMMQEMFGKTSSKELTADECDQLCVAIETSASYDNDGDASDNEEPNSPDNLGWDL